MVMLIICATLLIENGVDHETICVYEGQQMNAIMLCENYIGRSDIAHVSKTCSCTRNYLLK